MLEEKWQRVRGQLRDTLRESRQRKAKLQERKNDEEKIPAGNTSRRRQNSSAVKETKQLSTRSEAVAAVEGCKKEPSRQINHL